MAGLGRRGTRTWNCCPENEDVKVRSTKRRQPGSGVAGAEREGAAGAGAERRAFVEETSGGPGGVGAESPGQRRSVRGLDATVGTFSVEAIGSHERRQAGERCCPVGPGFERDETRSRVTWREASVGVEEPGTKSQGWRVDEVGQAALAGPRHVPGRRDGRGAVKGRPGLLVLVPASLAVSAVEGPDGSSGSRTLVSLRLSRGVDSTNAR